MVPFFSPPPNEKRKQPYLRLAGCFLTTSESCSRFPVFLNNDCFLILVPRRHIPHLKDLASGSFSCRNPGK